jgi:ribosomal protein S4
VDDHLQLFEILVTLKFAQSNSEARRLIRQGSVVVNGAICTEECMIPSKPVIIQVGKKGRKLIAQ